MNYQEILNYLREIKKDNNSSELYKDNWMELWWKWH
jgi:hypothetical protein